MIIIKPKYVVHQPNYFQVKLKQNAYAFHPNCMLIMKLKCAFQQQNSFPNKTSSLIGYGTTW